MMIIQLQNVNLLVRVVFTRCRAPAMRLLSSASFSSSTSSASISSSSAAAAAAGTSHIAGVVARSLSASHQRQSTGDPRQTNREIQWLPGRHGGLQGIRAPGMQPVFSATPAPTRHCDIQLCCPLSTVLNNIHVKIRTIRLTLDICVISTFRHQNSVIGSWSSGGGPGGEGASLPWCSQYSG